MILPEFVLVRRVDTATGRDTVSTATLISTVLRLADDSTVPIVIRPTPDGWLQAVTIDGDPVRHCKHGHLLITRTMYIRPNGAIECRMRRKRRNKTKNRARLLRYYYRVGKRKRQMKARRNHAARH